MSGIASDLVGLRGPRVRLVPLEKEQHLANYVRWFNDPEVTRYLHQHLPLSRAAEEAFFDRLADAEDMIVWAVLDEQGRHIGGTGLHRIHWPSRSATSGIVLGEKAAWGKGYGTEVMRVRTAWAFEDLGLHRIDSECYAENLGSARCLAKAGYRQVGVQRKKWWRRGEWHDCILWEILDEDYFAARGAAAASP
jgi:RimJ/RimL family protein N-acetyltransferase